MNRNDQRLITSPAQSNDESHTSTELKNQPTDLTIMCSDVLTAHCRDLKFLVCTEVRVTAGLNRGGGGGGRGFPADMLQLLLSLSAGLLLFITNFLPADPPLPPLLLLYWIH